jgi:hypothetical protein
MDFCIRQQRTLIFFKKFEHRVTDKLNIVKTLAVILILVIEW